MGWQMCSGELSLKVARLLQGHSELNSREEEARSAEWRREIWA